MMSGKEVSANNGKQQASSDKQVVKADRWYQRRRPHVATSS
jgi:hypothetical protein